MIAHVLVTVHSTVIVCLGSVQKLHHPGTREGGGVSEKMILDYVGEGRGIAKDDVIFFRNSYMTA